MYQSRITRTISISLAITFCASSALGQAGSTQEQDSGKPIGPESLTDTPTPPEKPESSPRADNPPSASDPPATATARVTVKSKEEDLVVGLVRSHEIATVRDVRVTGVSWNEECTAPCSFSTTPGVREIVLQSPRFTETYRLRLKPGNTVVKVDPGNPSLHTFGLVLLIIGAGLAVGGPFSMLIESGQYEEHKHNWGIPMLLSGLAMTAGGIGLMYSNRVKIDHKFSPNAPTPTKEAPVHMLTAQASF